MEPLDHFVRPMSIHNHPVSFISDVMLVIFDDLVLLRALSASR